MEKEMQTEKGAEKPAESQTPHNAKPTKIRIELELDLTKSGLIVRGGGTPTVIMSGVLKKCESIVPAPFPAEDGDPVRKILIDFDMVKDEIRVSSSADEIVYLGMIVMAHSAITQNQTLQRWQAAQASQAPAPRQHARGAARIVGPGGEILS